jgi:hypothetical protein
MSSWGKGKKFISKNHLPLSIFFLKSRLTHFFLHTKLLVMGLREKYLKMIDRKRSEITALREDISALQRRVAEGEVYICAIQEAIQLVPKESPSESGPTTLREGTKLARVRDLLVKRGVPLHISEILKGIGEEDNKSTRVGLVGSLGQYAREGKIFKKGGPNEFGLLDYPKTIGKLEDNADGSTINHQDDEETGPWRPVADIDLK